MASQEQETQGSSSTTSIDQPPLWEYVTKLEKLAGAGGCWKFKCNFCSETRQRSYSKVRAHFPVIKGTGIPVCKKTLPSDKINMKQFKCNFCSETRQGSYSKVRAHFPVIKGTGIPVCKKTLPSDKINMKQLEEAYEEKKVEPQAKEVELPCEACVGFKKTKGISTHIERAFGFEIRDQVDQEIAKMFYTGGLPFNLARNPHYLRDFQFAANGPLFLKAVNCFHGYLI